MRAGKLKDRVYLQSPVRTADGKGGFRLTGWTTEAVIWADIEPLTSRELLFAQGPHSATTHRATFRYRAGVLSTWRLLLGSRAFNFIGKPIEARRRRRLEALCTEML